ncbi:MAG: hypothetical protein IGR92_12930 [Leptolyngbyaceae cyanobacterium T60_A2020_046]|nr:hypothetical protein [Leptolyngbyaceae cyanobacterium T60_A2020_046]
MYRYPLGEWRQVGRDGQYFRIPLDGTPLGGETEAWVAQASLERPSAGAGNAEQRYVGGVQVFQHGQLTIAIDLLPQTVASKSQRSRRHHSPGQLISGALPGAEASRR